MVKSGIKVVGWGGRRGLALKTKHFWPPKTNFSNHKTILLCGQKGTFVARKRTFATPQNLCLRTKTTFWRPEKHFWQAKISLVLPTTLIVHHCMLQAPQHALLALLNTLLASQNLLSALQITSDDPKTLLVPREQTVGTYPKTKTF